MHLSEHDGTNQNRISHKEEDAVRVAKGKGAVSSVSRNATDLAIDVLADGGNAYDAAFVLAFALAIYHPQAGNLGGGGYLLFKTESGSPLLYNYRERSSSHARLEHYLNSSGNADPDVTSLGPSSVCVPGTVQAFFILQKEYGKLRTRDLLNTLAKKAEEGCSITRYQAACLNRLRSKLTQSPGTRRILVKEQGQYEPGDIIQNPDLGHTLSILAAGGPDTFYQGEIAEQIEKSITENGGYLCVDDLKKYEISTPEPIQTELNGYTIWSVPPEGGGSILIEIINILKHEGFLAAKPYTPDYYHYLAQAAKIAFIDRMDYMGAYGFEDNATYRAMSHKNSNLRRFTLIDAERDIPTAEYLSKLNKNDTMKMFQGMHDNSNTTHFSIVDAQGNAVSNSYTLNLRYGSKWTVEGTGLLMNGSTDSFSFVPGKANYFGVVGNNANMFEPNKRPASNMAPVLVTKNNDPYLLIGSPGGPTIPTSIAGVLFAVLVHGMDPRRCIAEGRIHHQAWPDTLFREDDPSLINNLKSLAKKGYDIQQRHEPIGDMHVVLHDQEGSTAISDFRREGAAGAL
jgi:gamma-glutamyltranspeptidase/glutathione hydrolase